MKRLSLSAFQIFCEGGSLPGFVVDSRQRVRYIAPGLRDLIHHGIRIPIDRIDRPTPALLCLGGQVYSTIQFRLNDSKFIGVIAAPLGAASIRAQKSRGLRAAEIPLLQAAG